MTFGFIWLVLHPVLVGFVLFSLLFCRSFLVLLSFFFWPLCYLSFDLRLLITSLVSSNSRPLCYLSFDLRFWLRLWYLLTLDHCVICPSIYGFWLRLWYLLTLDHCVICPSISGFWLRLWYLLTLDHCVICPSIYGFWLLLWYLQAFLSCKKVNATAVTNGVGTSDPSVLVVTYCSIFSFLCSFSGYVLFDL